MELLTIVFYHVIIVEIKTQNFFFKVWILFLEISINKNN